MHKVPKKMEEILFLLRLLLKKPGHSSLELPRLF